MILGLAWEIWLAPLREGSWLWLKVLPIALTMPGLVRGQRRGAQVALLVSVLYLTEACVRVFEPYPIRALALAQLLLVLLFFAAVVTALKKG